ncbi:hypothetical protein MJM04_33130, partial [Salmonella enterica subsp. enterica serovar Cerro]|nr:hypothetical protein [Salmonella enterica subsp. enterica serovar Cerro]
KEQNSHFEHGLKIIMTRLANQWQQKIDFLPPEEIDNADIAFLVESKKAISDVVYCRSTDRNDIGGVTRGYLPAKTRYRRQRQYAA